MIPRRVIVRGFLSYRDEAEIDFTGADLWMLGGANGSGKSAVFDAVTYSLFGKHRGGGSGADELLNKESESFAVEFEFALESGIYRVRKTLKRTKAGKFTASQQIVQLNGAAWVAVPDTGAKTGFDKWIRDHIGLTYDTFTSSVLLLQNKAERLIDATPKDRFAVLAGIVDLERFVRLHERADEERKELKRLAEALKTQRDLLPEIDPEELAALGQQIDAADAARQAQDDELARRREIETRSKDWAGLQQRVAQFRLQSEKNIALLREADAIERDLARLVELRAVVPHVETAFKLRAKLETGERDIKELATQLDKASASLTTADAQLTQARGELESLRTQLATADHEWQQAQAGQKKTAESVARLERYEEKRRELDSVADDLKTLPENLGAEVERLQKEVGALAEIATVYPILSRIGDHRRQLRELQPSLDLGDADLQRIAVEGKKAAAIQSTAAARVVELREAKSAAERDATKAQTLLAHAEQQLDAVATLSGAAECTYCGQPLTPEHFETEKSKRAAERDTAKQRVTESTSADRLAEQQLQKAEAAHTQETATVEKLREAYSTKKDDVTRIRTSVDGLKQAIQADRHTLPDSFQHRVNDNDTDEAAYPTVSDLSALKSRLAERDRLTAELERAKAGQIKREMLQKNHATVTRLCASLHTELGADPDAIRQEQARVEAEVQTRNSRFDGVKKQEKDTQSAVEKLAEQRQTLHALQTGAATKHTLAQRDLHHDRQLLDAAYAALPDSWRDQAGRARLAEVNALKSERDLLVEKQTEERAKALAGARTGHETLRVQLEDLQAEEDRIPQEARVAQPVAAMHVAEAKKQLAERELAVAAWRKQLALLEERQNRRMQVTLELAAAEKQHNDAQLLAELLGRDRLQRHLVKQAERQIVGFANAVLDRLSEGNLCLRLRGGADDDEPEKALELEAFNRATGKDAIGIAFLSGSQKFRVAVSLALGIGQFASRRHRPIETVIIDEGFGCLDRVGRQTMIQELNNLRGHLKCILLVSHQEEFADAFPHRYHFEVDEGTTRVTRVVR